MEEESLKWHLPKEYFEFANEEMPFTNEESLGTFYSEWDVHNWSTLDPKTISPTFKTNDIEWNLILFPKGNGQSQVVSLYLENKNCLTKDICAQFILCFVNPTEPYKYYFKASQHRFNSYETDWGFTEFIKTEQLAEQELFVNDTVKVLTIVRLFKDPTGVLWHKFINYDSKEMTGHVGLLNQGATCYMNSLFQSLFFTNLYRKAVFQIPTENDNPRQSIALALQRLFYNLQFSNHPVSTIEVTQSFGWDSTDAFMQHDIQEFNRLLQDNIEKKMQGTPAEDMIKRLFMGKTKSYIKCIHVDYESSRTENYYDIQLNVKGCKNLQESFKNYVQEEILEGENKYMADHYELQDAKKGVIFESFPPVLHLQLKRFEYDMIKDRMVKINDRYEFPPEIDLKCYMIETEENKNERFNYILHGVLVHTGDLMGGHYFAFVRPSEENKWFKFDDDRVTPVSLSEVLEDNFGGIALYPEPKMKNIERVTNAYMLVYIRESQQEEILKSVTDQDIPLHLIERIHQEELLMKEIEKQKSEEHLYMKLFIVHDYGFRMNQGFDFVQQDDRIQPPTVEFRLVLRDQPLKEFLTDYYNEKQMTYRAWNIMNRKNNTVRLDAPFNNEDLELSLESLSRKISNLPILRFYMESPIFDHQGQLLFPSVEEKSIILIFIKYFDPITQRLSGLTKLYVHKDNLISIVQDNINALLSFKEGNSLDIYEEECIMKVRLLDKNTTFNENDIIDGDILCVQQSEKNLMFNSNDERYKNIKEYFEYLLQKIDILFIQKNSNQRFYLSLRKDMKYFDLIRKISNQIGIESDYIQLFLSNEQPIKFNSNLTIEDILQFNSREYKNIGLYYDILPIRLSELEFKKLVHLNLCYPTLNQIQKSLLILPQHSTLSLLDEELEPKQQKKRAYIIRNHQLIQVVDSIDLILNEENEENIFVEVIPTEELNKTNDDFYIKVFHYQNDIYQPHSIPFEFLVLKDELFSDTKSRLKSRIGLNDHDFNRIKFNIVSINNQITSIKEDNFKLFDYSFKSTDQLGLNYQNPLLNLNERKLFIKE